MMVRRAIALIVIGASCAQSPPRLPADAGDLGASPICLAGQRQCDGNNVVTCADGGWVVAETCGANGVDAKTTCNLGACTECAHLRFGIMTYAACALSLVGGVPVDGEAFINLQGQDFRVFALNRWGAGHLVAWCDMTTVGDLLKAFDLLGYLGRVQSPRVAVFGAPYCEGATAAVSGRSWFGDDLPIKYKGNAALLAADWDVIILCGLFMPWRTDWSAELAAFVQQHGKGFLAVSDYVGPGPDYPSTNPTDIQNMNKITVPAGLEFVSIQLPWAPLSAAVDLACVPDVPIG